MKKVYIHSFRNYIEVEEQPLKNIQLPTHKLTTLFSKFISDKIRDWGTQLHDQVVKKNQQETKTHAKCDNYPREEIVCYL